MTREQLIDLLYAQTPLFVTRESFAHSLHEWDIQPVHVDGELAFITVVRGAEFHFASLGKQYIISRRMIRDFLRPLIEKYGHAETRAPHDDNRQRRLNRKIGFRVTGSDQYDHFYRIEALPDG